MCVEGAPLPPGYGSGKGARPSPEKMNVSLQMVCIGEFSAVLSEGQCSLASPIPKFRTILFLSPVIYVPVYMMNAICTVLSIPILCSNAIKSKR